MNEGKIVIQRKNSVTSNNVLLKKCALSHNLL